MRGVVDAVWIAIFLLALLVLAVTLPVRWSGQWRWVAAGVVDTATITVSR